MTGASGSGVRSGGARPEAGGGDERLQDPAKIPVRKQIAPAVQDWRGVFDRG